MPARYHINREDEFVAFRFEGAVDLVDAYELCQSLIGDPEFDSTLPQLVDVRGAQVNIERGAMRPFIQYVTKRYRPRVDAPIAVVLDGTMDDEFCAGMFRFVCKLQDAEVFDDYALAIKWLLRDDWRRRKANGASAQPNDPPQDQADEEPKQIRA